MWLQLYQMKQLFTAPAQIYCENPTFNIRPLAIVCLVPVMTSSLTYRTNCETSPGQELWPDLRDVFSC
jgi:hypothetical protein